MPFGLINALATFQKLINDTLKDYLNNFAAAYLNNIIIFSKTYKEHIQHITKVLKRLEEKALPLKLSKCEFYKSIVKFLGLVISENQISIDFNKIKVILD